MRPQDKEDTGDMSATGDHRGETQSGMPDAGAHPCGLQKPTTMVVGPSMKCFYKMKIEPKRV